MTTDANSWFPLFEFQDWVYQSYLLLPTPAERDAAAGSPVTAKTWGKGEFICGQAFNAEPGYILNGALSFREGMELDVSIKGVKGVGNAPAGFEAVGTGTRGPTRGAISKLVGWVFPVQPIQNDAAKVLTVQGSVWAVRGPDSRPELDLSGMPLGTVGAFVISRKA